MPDASKTVTQLLGQWQAGNVEALDQLTPLVYDELRRLARKYMQSERPDHTLQATALVHEAYVRLVDVEIGWRDRAHFFAVAARAMRRVLVDHGRAKHRAKRGRGVANLPLDEDLHAAPQVGGDVVALDEALQRLAKLDDRKSKITELHHFGGLTCAEMAEVLGSSPATVDRELKLAEAWLYNQLSRSKS